MRQPKVAIDHLQKALQLDPLSPGRHNMLEGTAIAKVLLKQYSDAIPLLCEAAEISPMPETHLFPEGPLSTRCAQSPAELEPAAPKDRPFWRAHIGEGYLCPFRGDRTPWQREIG